MAKLAINGGPKVKKTLFPSQNTYTQAEQNAVNSVMKGGRLSWYRGNWTEDFYGGPEIRRLESAWSSIFNVNHSICCNSATSGLHIALGAVGVGPGDEVIVSPYSMTCSATMPLAWGAKPVFVDVEKEGFCIDYDSVKAAITEKTKAILAVSLFGQPFDPRIKEFGIPIVEDAAQALGSFYRETKFGRPHYAGTLGHIGVFSFNYGKHLTCGEGGMVVTNYDELGFKCRLLMNHAEAVINDAWGSPQISHELLLKTEKMFGFNLRMDELRAAIIYEQLKKFEELLHIRRGNVKFLYDHLRFIPPIIQPKVRENCVHTYYVMPFLWDKEKSDGITRNLYVNAVKAELTPREGRDTEGVQIGCGYIKPIYRMPIFSDQNWSFPNVEELHGEKLFLTLLHSPKSTLEDMEDVARAFMKVWTYRDELR